MYQIRTNYTKSIRIDEVLSLNASIYDEYPAVLAIDRLSKDFMQGELINFPDYRIKYSKPPYENEDGLFKLGLSSFISKRVNTLYYNIPDGTTDNLQIMKMVRKKLII